MCEQILKKKTAPQYNSNSLNCKNQEKANNSPRYCCAAINQGVYDENDITHRERNSLSRRIQSGNVLLRSEQIDFSSAHRSICFHALEQLKPSVFPPITSFQAQGSTSWVELTCRGVKDATEC